MNNSIFPLGTDFRDQQAQKTSTRLSKMDESVAEYEYQARKEALQKRFKVSRPRPRFESKNKETVGKENQRPIVILSDVKEQQLIPRAQKILGEIKAFNESTRNCSKERTPSVDKSYIGLKEGIYERQQNWYKSMYVK